MEGFPDRIFQRDVTILQVASKGAAAHAIGIFFRGFRTLKGVFAHAFVSRIDVKIPHAFEEGIADGGRTVVPDHGGRIAVPAREYGHPAAFAVFIGERLHHFSAPGGGREDKQRMQGPVGVPHGIIVVMRNRALPDRRSGRERRIASIYVADGPREERGPIQGSVELSHQVFVFPGHLHLRKMPLPDGGEALPSLIKVVVRNLCLQILYRALVPGEGSAADSGDGGLSRPAPQLHIQADAGSPAHRRSAPHNTVTGIGSEGLQLLFKADDKIAAVACRLAPSLINSVDGIVAPDFLSQGIQFNVPFAFVAVGVHDEKGRRIFWIGKTENGAAGAAGHLGQDTFSVQVNSVIGGCCGLTSVLERGGPFHGSEPAHAGGGKKRHGAVVLRAAACDPVRTSKALEKRIPVIVRRNAFFLRIPRLGRPEGHSIGFQDRRQRLAIFFTPLPVSAFRIHAVGICPYPCIYIRNQLGFPTRGTSSHEANDGKFR